MVDTVHMGKVKVKSVTRPRGPSSACGRGSGSAGGILWPRICQYCLDQQIMATSGRRIDLEYTYSSHPILYTAIHSFMAQLSII